MDTIPTVSGTDQSKLAEYEIHEKIGEGHFAQVYRATRKFDGMEVAIKGTRIFEMEKRDRQLCINEAIIHRRVKHPNIVRCLDLFIENNDLYIIMEMVPQGDLLMAIQDKVTNNEHFPEETIWVYVLGVSTGLAHMHGQRIMHRDIKPANIYIDDNGHAMLGDLGLGRIFNSGTQYAASVVGTPYYMSPELIQGNAYNHKSDVWSLGCLIYQLAMLRVPFMVEDSSNFFALGQNIINCHYPPLPDQYSPMLSQMVASILQKDVKDRPSASEIAKLAHRVLTILNDDTDRDPSTLSVADIRALSSRTSSSSSSSSTTTTTTTRANFMQMETDSRYHHANDTKLNINNRYADDKMYSDDESGLDDTQNMHSDHHQHHHCSHNDGNIQGNDPNESNELSNYEDLGFIAAGKFSEVRRARRLDKGDVVALKKVQIFDMDSEGRKQVINEARILQSLPTHSNIITYLDSFIHNNELFLVLELADSGDFASLLAQARDKNEYFSERTIWHYFSQIAEALQVMHNCRIMHRDIKPANVFLTKSHELVKLGDLGLGKYLSSKTYTTYSVVGTPHYMSPEAISDSECGYDFKSDMWSLGCLLYECCALHPPFESKNLNYYTLGNAIKSGQYPPIPDHYSDTMHELIANLIVVDPNQRMTIDQTCQIAGEMYAAFSE